MDNEQERNRRYAENTDRLFLVIVGLSCCWFAIVVRELINAIIERG